MTEKAQQVIAMALELDPDERREVVSRLLASLEEQSGLHSSWSAETIKRIDDLDSGHVTAIPWAEARAQLQGRRSADLG